MNRSPANAIRSWIAIAPPSAAIRSIERPGLFRTGETPQATAELPDQGVDISAMLLKPNMVHSGYGATAHADYEEVGNRTLETGPLAA
jgi:hypothetical protein